ncbi:MAG: hypothetical protein IT373_16160 [Polyangiaceae bacterium]|nr:hypothetical protein [Polyangiaceae bacterium]
MRRAPELLVALVLVAAITVAYLLAVPAPLTAAGALVGHGFGIAGFVLMLATETLYTVRKRSRGRAWGPMRTWLRAHIVTGIVGPYLVLLHGAFRFGGLAGACSIATAVVVVSGFVGRYLYTAVPRSPEGDELDAGATPGAARARRLLALWHVVHVPLGLVLFALAFAHVALAIYFATTLA